MLSGKAEFRVVLTMCGAPRGSGTSVQEVNQLLRQYAQMRKMFQGMSKPSFARRVPGMKMQGM
jgi:signal recognition particle GTPase